MGSKSCVAHEALRREDTANSNAARVQMVLLLLTAVSCSHCSTRDRTRVPTPSLRIMLRRFPSVSTGSSPLVAIRPDTHAHVVKTFSLNMMAGGVLSNGLTEGQ